MKLYSTKEAAEYLSLSVSAVKYHIYTSRNLQPALVGGALIFTQAQLDEFSATKRGPGRPRKEEEMSKTLVVCGKCGKTAEYSEAVQAGWLISRRKDAPYGYLVIRCPDHITEYAKAVAQ